MTSIFQRTTPHPDSQAVNNKKPRLAMPSGTVGRTIADNTFRHSSGRSARRNRNDQSSSGHHTRRNQPRQLGGHRHYAAVCHHSAGHRGSVRQFVAAVSDDPHQHPADRPGHHAVSQSESDGDCAQHDHGRAVGTDQKLSDYPAEAGGSLSGGRQRPQRHSRSDCRRASGHCPGLGHGSGHRPGRSRHSGRRADQRLSQGD